jgi:hypothetical protein
MSVEGVESMWVADPWMQNPHPENSRAPHPAFFAARSARHTSAKIVIP